MTKPMAREKPPSEEDLAILWMKGVRSEDIQEILERVGRVALGELRLAGNPEYYPVRFFVDGVEAYQYMFDNASIYYSAAAVELALILKLRDKIDQMSSKKIPTFKWLIDHCDELDQQMRQQAQRVRKTRNSYVHYQNMIGCNSYFEARWQLLSEQLRQLKRVVKDQKFKRQLGRLIKAERPDKAPMPVFRLQKVEMDQELVRFVEE